MSLMRQIKQSGTVEAGSALKVVGELERLQNGKVKCRLADITDGKENVQTVFTSQAARELGGALKSEACVRLQEANLTAVGESHVLIVAKAELLEEGVEQQAPPGTTADAMAAGTAPSPIAAAPAAMLPEQEPAAPEPAAPMQVEPAVAKTPAAALKTAGVQRPTPANHPTPPSAGWAQKQPGSASKRPLQPITTLNPYNNGWAIKAKVISKGPKRSFARGSVFTAEIVDEAGTAIEATFWRDAAERAHELLEEGKVYIFGRGSVKPADKRYSRVRNDYALHFDNGSELEACADDIDTSSMAVRIDPVPIDQLAAYVDKKMVVDVLGVACEVRPLGSVKRKTDQAELSRRDIVLVDQSLKTVVVTLWGGTAESHGQALEEAAAGGAAPVIAISSCRVSSYNGVSVSSLQRSAVLINPDLPEAVALKSWYEESGRGAATAHVGEGLATALQSGGGNAVQERVTLEGFRSAAPGSMGDKPHYATITATFAMVDPEQSLYYMANPENNRKVVEQGPGLYFCEYDGSTLPAMVRRYVFAARVMDASGEATVQVFNEQAEQLLGMKADDLAEVRDTDTKRYQEILKAVLWRDNALRLKAQAQEYQGNTRVRMSLADLRPFDYVAECRRMLVELAAEVKRS